MIDEVIHPIIYTSLTDDEYLHCPYFKATLNNGITVYSKPGRRSWLELKSWIQTHPGHYITKLQFGFRDNVQTVCEGKLNYFFTNSMLAHSDGWEQRFYVGGYQSDDQVKIFKYMVPEIYLQEEDWRGLDDLSVKRGLIVNQEI